MKRTGPIRSKPSPNNPTAQQRILVMERAGGSCERCGAPDPLRVHHRKLRSQGGDNKPANLAALCDYCHFIVHVERLVFGEPFGWIVPSHGRAAGVPIKHRRLGYVLLTPDGGYESAVAAPVGVPVDEPASSALSVTVSLDQDRRSGK